ncbi:MAG: type II toxin-antitoxin system HipA family toxin [Pseudomonadota bacterium]
MARQLDVFLHGHKVGLLEQDEAGQLRFAYDAAWLADPARAPLSLSLPLRPEPFGHREARPFFAGLLPEAEKRDLVARALGISARNDFAMIDRIGGECAGAVTFRHPGEEPPARTAAAAGYRPLGEDELARIIEILPERPLLAGEAGVRLSLAGAQDKLPVLLRDGRIALPLDDRPSSHILKPPIRRFEDTVHNEGFCLALARALGLHAVAAELRSVKGRDFLLVERYDRRRAEDGTIRRLHQEDFCQALGYPPEIKYQAEGGPTLARCFELVRRASARPAVDLLRLLDGVLFNLLVGNNDAHAKNFSLLYDAAGTELAPLYDISSTAVYPGLSPRFAMKLAGKDEFDQLHPRHWERFAKETGLGAPQVRRRLLELARRLPPEAQMLRAQFAAAGQDRPVVGRIVGAVEARAKQIIERFKD